MRRARSSHSPGRPSASQLLVIRTALAEDGSAITHWSTWLEKNDLDHVDYGSFRLLPLVFRNLGDSDHGGTDFAKLRSASRQSWYRNQLLLERTANLVGDLTSAGIPVIVLGGIPLALRSYADLGARHMTGSDLLIPGDHLPSASAILVGSGWAPTADTGSLDADSPATTFATGDGLQTRLHQHLLTSHRFDGAVAPFVAGATFVTVDEQRFPVLNPTDELLQTLLLWSDPRSSEAVSWIPDAVLSIRTHGSRIDWARLAAIATELQSALRARAALEYLNRVVPGAVDPAAIAGLEAGTRGERVEQWFRSRTSERYLWGRLPEEWFAFRRAARAGGSTAGPAGFVRHLQRNWGTASLNEFVHEIGRRGRRRAGRALTSSSLGQHSHSGPPEP